MYLYIYIYIYRKRERKRESKSERINKNVFLCKGVGVDVSSLQTKCFMLISIYKHVIFIVTTRKEY